MNRQRSDGATVLQSWRHFRNDSRGAAAHAALRRHAGARRGHLEERVQRLRRFREAIECAVVQLRTPDVDMSCEVRRGVANAMTHSPAATRWRMMLSATEGERSPAGRIRWELDVAREVLRWPLTIWSRRLPQKSSAARFSRS